MNCDEALNLVKDYKDIECGRWHFIADYCRNNHPPPFDSEVYDMVGKKFDTAIKIVTEGDKE